MDLNKALKNAQLCEKPFTDVLNLFHENIKNHNYSPSFQEIECETAKNNYARFKKVHVAFSNKKDFYIIFYFDLNEKKSILALVHENKEPTEYKLIEISKFASQTKTPNGIVKNDEYFTNHYTPVFLPQNKIVFCRQYTTEEIKQQNFSESFKKDYDEIFSLFNQIEKSIENKGADL